jgi:hypothetical protein
LEPLLQRLFIFIVGTVFDGDGVVTFTNFTMLFRVAFSLSLHIFYQSRREGGSETYFTTLSYNIHHI